MRSARIEMGLRPIPVGSCGFAAGEIPGVQPGKAEHMGLRPIPHFLLYQKEAKINSALRAVLSLRSEYFNRIQPRNCSGAVIYI